MNRGPRQPVLLTLCATLLSVALAALGCAGSSPAPAPIEGAPLPRASGPSEASVMLGAFDLLGEAVVSAEATLDGAQIGGLSSITYDAHRDLYYAVSDDPATRGSARFYTLDIDLAGESLTSTQVEVIASTELLDRNGEPFAAMALDLESLVLTPERTLYVSSEGQADRGVDPFLREYRLDGSYVRDFSIPEKFLPTDQTAGIRHNLGFESIAFDAERGWLYTATENALSQDGPKADLAVASPSRILRLDRATGKPLAEFVYQVEPVSEAPVSEADFRTRGLVAFIALDENHLLSLERAYTQGVGNQVEIFLVSLEGATNVRPWKSLEGKSYRPVSKTLLLPLDALPLELDNLEGMTFGPRLPDGRKSLVLIADNNFNSRQRNQLLALALDERQLDPSLVQGPGHRSPLEGSWVRGIRGTVTSPAARGPGFWMQGPEDQDEATSDAVFVLPEGSRDEVEEVSSGDVVVVDGLVTETGFGNGLTVTSLNRARIAVAARGARLPDPVEIQTNPSPAAPTVEGAEENARVRRLPRQIDDDGLEVFEPKTDAIDFLESLEGMRVSISNQTVVGSTTRFGEFALLPRNGKEPGVVRSFAGGLVITSDQPGPLPLVVAARSGTAAPQVAVGDTFEGSILGVLDYGFGSYRILSDDLPEPTPGSRRSPSAPFGPPDDSLLLATYNVENLSAQSGADKFERVGTSIAKSLSSPDIVALQEIQDDTGPDNDGTVSANQTLSRLVEAIRSAGGSDYEFVAIDPEDVADGGQPGANIRVAFLYRPERVRFVARGVPQADSAGEWLLDERGPFLSPNPARVNPSHPAFGADPARNQSGSRKPLVAEFEFGGQRLFLINVHLRSKRGDSPLLGAVQPPTRPTESLRAAETLVIRSFLDDLFDLDPNAATIVLGDFNEHPYREPVRSMAGTTLTNLVDRVPESLRYTYIYRGRSQVLDNVLASTGLAERSQTEIVHINCDRPHGERAADHDPVLVQLQLP